MFKKKHWPRCFWRCLKKTETSCSRCILAMFFKRLKSSGKFYTYFSNVKQRANFQNSNSVFGVCKSYSGLHFWLNNQTFFIALNGVPKGSPMLIEIEIYLSTLRFFGYFLARVYTKTEKILKTAILTFGRESIFWKWLWSKMILIWYSDGNHGKYWKIW